MKILKLASDLNFEVPNDMNVVVRRYPGGEDVADPSEIRDLLVEGLQHYFNRFDPQGYDNLKRRYKLFLTDVREDYRETMFTIKLRPLGEEKGEEESISEDDPRYELYNSGKTGKVFYKNPKEAIDSIPVNNDLAYRGISWEEWQFIKDNGVISSKGSMNLGQENLTLFSPDPGTAEHYASGFAPLQYQVTPKTPGVVIAVPKEQLLTSDDRSDIPSSELGYEGELSADNIVNVWFLVAVSSRRSGFFELIIPWEFTEDRHLVLNPAKSRIGSANLSSGVSYAVIQKH